MPANYSKNLNNRDAKNAEEKKSAQKNKVKVCIIVDNPLRDFDGLVLLARVLAKRDIDVFLVPMYKKSEVFLLRPDLVLVNFARKANEDFIDLCNKLGILVGVLDTEGGVYSSADFKRIASYIAKTDLYCLWGKNQFNALHDCNILDDKLLKITGCPRYDFLALPWKKGLQKISNIEGRVVLINTNFPLIHPRFQTAEEEIDALSKGPDSTEEYVREYVSQAWVAFRETVKTIKHIAASFRDKEDVTFIIRPHPFEKKDVFEEIFLEYSNVEVHQSGPSFPWINRSDVMIHYNCTTSIEAVMLGIEPILMHWIEAPLREQQTTIDISQHAHSMYEVEEMLRNILNNKKLEVTPELKANRKNVVENWFSANDGKCSERVANAMVETIKSRKCDKHKSSSLYMIQLIREFFVQNNFKPFAALIIQIVFGAKFVNRLRMHILRRSPTNRAKEFNSTDVKTIVNRLQVADDNNIDFSIESSLRSYSIAVKREKSLG
jgi:surface carbohydrate biosynthesis protein